MSQRVQEKKSWKRRLLVTAGAGAVLLVGLYFLLTSTAFVRAFVLPRVGAWLGAELTVGAADIRPWSRIELRDLRVQTGDREPMLEIGRLRARYDGWALLRGRVVVEECLIEEPRVQVVRVEGGRGNLPLRFESARPGAPPGSAPAAGRGPAVRVRDFTLTNAFVRVVDRDRAGLTTATTFSNLSLRLDRFADGEPGRLTLNTALRAERKTGPGAGGDFFEARAEAAFAFETTPALKLDRIEGTAEFTVAGAGGALRELADLRARLNLLLEGTALTRCDLAFDQRGVRVGTARASGTFDPAKTEGQLRLNIDSINRQVLNLVAARYGIEFQQSGIGANVALSLAQGGQSVAAEGRVVGRQLAVRRDDAPTPVVDADLDFSLRADRAARRLHWQKLELVAREGATELLTARLDYPMEYSWATNAARSFTRSTLSLVLTRCELAAWRALHGRTNLAGQADARLALTTLPGGNQLQFTGAVQTRQFAIGGLRQARAELAVNAGYSVTNGVPVIAGMAKLGAPGAAAGDLLPAALALEAQFEFARTATELEARPGTVRLSRAGAPAGTITFNGRHSTTNSAGEWQFKLTGVNERALAAVFGPALASALLEGDVLARRGPGGLTSLDANLALSRVAAASPAGAVPPAAATVRLALESRGAVHELKRGVLNLAPGATPANELEVTGLLDLRAEKPEPSRLNLQAAFLDVTTWWNALAPAAPASADGSAPSAPRRDPAAVRLPVRQFTLDARLGTVRARELTASNVVMAARLSEGLLAVKPLEATLNGAPVSGLIDANLGVPGWLYNVDLRLDRVPLRPLESSFAPGAPAKLSGALTLNGEFKGAGLTYETLRHKFNGTARFDLTNAAIEFAPGWKQGVLVTVATLLRTPEIAGGPIAWAGGGATMGGGQLDLQAVNVGTEAFIAGITGRVPLGEALTNSALDLPVTLQLRRTLAEKAKLAVAGPPDAPFAALPDFLRARGTLGRPRAEINKVALGSVVLQSLGNVPGLGDEKTRALIQGLGGLLTPKPASTNAPPAPTSPAPPK